MGMGSAVSEAKRLTLALGLSCSLFVMGATGCASEDTTQTQIDEAHDQGVQEGQEKAKDEAQQNQQDQQGYECAHGGEC
jgi:hypothetical protein